MMKVNGVVLIVPGKKREKSRERRKVFLGNRSDEKKKMMKTLIACRGFAS